jgi:hypothetical protein
MDRRSLVHVGGWLLLLGAVTLVVPAQALSGRNTVYSDDIVNRQVKRVDIAPNAVNSYKVANGSLTSADIRDHAIKPWDMAARTLPAPIYASDTWTIPETGDWVYWVFEAVAPADAVCHVVTSFQWTDSAPLAAEGDTGADVRVGAYVTDGTEEWVFGDEGTPFALTRTAVDGAQPVQTRSATEWVSDGELFGFGLALDNVPASMVGDTVAVQTSATCGPTGIESYFPNDDPTGFSSSGTESQLDETTDR